MPKSDFVPTRVPFGLSARPRRGNQKALDNDPPRLFRMILLR